MFDRFSSIECWINSSITVNSTCEMFEVELGHSMTPRGYFLLKSTTYSSVDPRRAM